MTDLGKRFRSLDRVAAPDLWWEATQRAAAPAAAREVPGIRRFAPVGLIAAAVAIVLVALGVLVRPPNVGPPPPPASEAATPQAGDVGAIAYVAESGLSTLHLVRPNKPTLQLAPSAVGIGNEVTCPSFSPDRTLLSVGMPGGTIGLIPIDRAGVIGSPTRLDAPVAETPHCAVWAPDSSAVAFLDGTALVIVPLEGEPRRVEDWDTSDASDPFATDYPADRAVQWSPDGSVIAVARPSGTWLVPVDGAAPRLLHEAPAFSVSWSPEGTRLVIGAGGPHLVIRAADGETLAELSPGLGPPVWSPVDDRIAFSDRDARLVVVGSDGGDPIVVAEYGYHPTWSSDGRRLIFVQDTASTAWRLVMADAAGAGERTTIVDSVSISDARSFPTAEQFSWQPVQPRR